jgi:hypothetical protein
MPRHEPSGRLHPGELLGEKVVMRRGADGKLQVVLPDRALKETTEAAERPPVGDDPRSGPLRDAPPYGGV